MFVFNAGRFSIGVFNAGSFVCAFLRRVVFSMCVFECGGFFTVSFSMRVVFNVCFQCG